MLKAESAYDEGINFFTNAGIQVNKEGWRSYVFANYCLLKSYLCAQIKDELKTNFAE